jgi:hypothetical protein
MAFCNSCGATLNAGTKFCNKCGAAVPATPGAVAAPLPSAPPASQGGGSSALKIILIIIAVIVGVGLLGMVTCGIVLHRAVKNAHISQNGDSVKVETPFGNMETSKDPEQAAKDLGIDLYPGAEAQKNGSATMTFGNVHTVTASFVSSDSLDKVCAFYKSRFPNAMTTSSDQNRCTIISNDQKNMITINIEANGDGTKFQISNVSKKSGSMN